MLFTSRRLTITTKHTPTLKHHRHISAVSNNTTEPNQVRPYKEIPTVSGIPILRDLKAAKSVSSMGALDYYEKYGDIIRFNIGSKKFVSLFTPELAKEFMAYEPAMPEGIASTLWPIQIQNEVVKDFGSNGINSSGIEWKNARDYFQGNMFPPKESQFYFPHIDRSAAYVVGQLESVDGQDQLQDTLMKIAFELFHGFMYGRPSHIFAEDIDPDYLTLLYSSKEFITAIGQLMQYQEWMQIMPSVKRKVDHLKEHSLKAAVAWNEIGEKRILEMMNVKDELTLTSYIAKLAHSDTHDLSYAVKSTGLFLSAAVDTTSSALIWILYHTAANPDKQEELFQQLEKELKGEGLTCQEDADRIPLLNGIIKESQRLNPVSGGTIRTYDQDVVVKGYNIPAGTTVFVFPSCTTGRNPEVFESPRSFIPERWFPEAKSARRKNKTAFPHDSPFTLMQFSIGPRMCLGARIAHVELLCILARIVQKYKVSFEEGKPIPSFDNPSGEQGLNLPDPFPFLKFTSRN